MLAPTRKPLPTKNKFGIHRAYQYYLLRGLQAAYLGQGLLDTVVKTITGNSFRGARAALAANVNPFLRKALRTWFRPSGIDCPIVSYDEASGNLDVQRPGI